MHPGFWKTLPGIATITAAGAAVAAGVTWAVVKVTTPAAAVTAPTATAAATYYLFDVTTPYASNDPTGAALKTVTAALVAAGFSPTALQVYMDPENANGWVGSGIWLGSGAPIMPAVSGAITSATQLATIPPTPTTYPGLVAGSWYTFSARTLFTLTAPQASANASALLVALGFSSATLQIAASNSDPQMQTWNVVAQWTGLNGATACTDAPPLLIIVPPGPSAATATTSQPPAVTTA